MLTFPKLIAGLWFAALAFYAGGLVIPLLPEGTQLGKFPIINALIGFVMGWRFMGRRAYDQLSQMLGYGATTSALLLFWALLTYGGYEMYGRAIKMRYDGPTEALVGMADHIKDYAILIATPTVLGALLVGGIIGGYITWFTAQRAS